MVTYFKINVFIVHLELFSNLGDVQKNVESIKYTWIVFVFVPMVLKKLEKIVLKIKFVEQTNNMIIDKTNVFVKKDLLHIKDNADNAQLDQLLLMVTHVFVIQIIKYMMKNQINARRDVYKINSGYWVNASVWINMHGGIKSVENVQIMHKCHLINQLVYVGAQQLITIPKQMIV